MPVRASSEAGTVGTLNKASTHNCLALLKFCQMVVYARVSMDGGQYHLNVGLCFGVGNKLNLVCYGG